MVAAPLFSTLPLYGPRATDFERALSNIEIEPIGNFETSPQIAPSPNAPLPKSWYTIVSGPFKGVRFANYEREIRLEVQGHSNCHVFGHEAGVIDENSASRPLRKVRKQRVRGAHEKEMTDTSTPAPAPRPQPASAPAKPSSTMGKNVATAGRTPNSMVAPERRLGTQQLKSSETTPATVQPPMPTPERAQSKISTAAWVAMCSRWQ
eukprot:6177063-Pleurochrysis_carterae.AAC.1